MASRRTQRSSTARRRPAAGRRRSSTPIPIKLIAAPVKIGLKVRKARRRARTLDGIDRAAAALERATSGQPAAAEAEDQADGSGLYRHRRWVRVFWFAGALLVVRLMALVPLLAVPTMLALVVGLVLAAWWLHRVRPGWLAKLPEDAPAEGPRRWLAQAARAARPRTAAAATVLAAVLWLAAPFNPWRSLPALVVGAAAVAGVRAWHFRVRQDEPAPAADEETPDAVWSTYLAEQGRLPGSRMEGWAYLYRPGREGDDAARIGWYGGVRLPRDSKGAAALVPAARGPIATVYGAGLSSVMTDLDPDDNGRFKVTVLDRGANAIKQVHHYDGTDFDPATGQFTFGTRADWTPGRIELYHPERGARHGHVSGSTSGGKSAGAETMLRLVCQHNVVVPVIIDMKVATFVDWAGYAPVFESAPMRALRVLENMQRLVEYRQSVLRTMRRYDPETGEDIGVAKCMPVTPEQPFIYFVIDEWHVLFKNETKIAGSKKTIGQRAIEIVEYLVTQARTSMVGVLLISQGVSVEHGFGNNTNIRRQVQAGYMVAFKNDPGSARQAFGKEIEVDPSTIPGDCPGTCFMTSTIDARDAMMRTIYIDAPFKLNRSMQIPTLPAAERDILLVGLGQDEEAEALPAAAPVAPEAAPAAAPAPVEAAPDDTPDGSQMRAEIAEAVELYVISQSEPVRRKDLYARFVETGRCGSTLLDEVLRDAVTKGVLIKPVNGKYSAPMAPVGKDHQ